MPPDADPGWTWERALASGPGLILPDRTAVSGPPWLYLVEGTAPPRDPADPMVFTSTKLRVYFDAGTVRRDGGAWSVFAAVPHDGLVNAIGAQRYQGLAIDPRTFTDVADALITVTSWLSGTATELARRQGGISTGFQGTAAAAFRDLVGRLAGGLRNLRAQLVTDPPVPYEQTVSDAGRAARDLLTDLWNAHQHWLDTFEHDPLDAVRSVLRELALPDTGTAAPARVTQQTRYGDLTTSPAWQAVEAAAKRRWNATVDSLDTSANNAMTALTTQYGTTSGMLVPVTGVATTGTPPPPHVFNSPAATGAAPPNSQPNPGAPNGGGNDSTTGDGSDPTTGPGTPDPTPPGADLFTPTALLFTGNPTGNGPGGTGADGSTTTDGFTGRIGSPPPPALGPATLPFTLLAVNTAGSGTPDRNGSGALPLGRIGAPSSSEDDDRTERTRTGVADDLAPDDTPAGAIGHENEPSPPTPESSTSTPPGTAAGTPTGAARLGTAPDGIRLPETGLPAGEPAAAGMVVPGGTGLIGGSGFPGSAGLPGGTGVPGGTAPAVGSMPGGSTVDGVARGELLRYLNPAGPGGGGLPVNGAAERERLAWRPADSRWWGTRGGAGTGRVDDRDPDIGIEPDPEEEFLGESTVEVIGRPGAAAGNPGTTGNGTDRRTG